MSSLARREDFDACRVILARGSKSFHFASRALPSRLVEPVSSFYAFCRVSDDAIDESADPQRAITEVRTRVDGIFAASPIDHPVDRAFAETVRTSALPRAPIDALLEGYAWDVEGRSYETLSDVIAYATCVAASVGVGMTWLMGRRDRSVLARAADLGVAMQLTNIARDVGEDARRGRIYLPLAWLREEGIAPASLLAEPRFSASLGRVTQRLLQEAETLYVRAEPGIEALPADSRRAIRLAAHLYREIGRIIAQNGYDAVGGRASTSTVRKIGVTLGVLASRPPLSARDPRLALDQPPLPEVERLLPTANE
jgi:15-cis-phytoene synthase